MSAIDTLFQQLRTSGRKALMPFITAGDPNLDFTAQVIRELASRGSAMCELGIPYSDPIADGPVIQASYTRALDRGIKLPNIFKMVNDVSSTVETPIVTMSSYAIIHRYGPQRYVAEARAAGVAGAIVPDLPLDGSKEMADISRREDFSLIRLVTPMTPPERALRIAEASSGFLYYVSVAGVTGERRELPPELVDNVSRLREKIDLPVCIGFGISTPDHVRQLAPVADGLIVGSAVVKRVAEANRLPHAKALDAVGRYVGTLVAALDG